MEIGPNSYERSVNADDPLLFFSEKSRWYERSKYVSIAITNPSYFCVKVTLQGKDALTLLFKFPFLREIELLWSYFLLRRKSSKERNPPELMEKY